MRPPESASTLTPAYGQLLGDLKARIHAAQITALRAVNKELIALYRDIGRNIDERQQSEGWGKGVVEALSRNLRTEFGEKSGYSERNLWYMLIFYREYKDLPKLQPLAAESAWTKNTLILDRCNEPLQREFYLVALNEKMKLEGENDAIGIIVCKSKKRTVVEYALKSTTLPIGIATYGLTSRLPDAYRNLLPSEDEIVARLAGWKQEE